MRSVSPRISGTGTAATPWLQRCGSSSPELILFAGGPEPTADPEGMLRDASLRFPHPRGRGVRFRGSAGAPARRQNRGRRGGYCLPGRRAGSDGTAEAGRSCSTPFPLHTLPAFSLPTATAARSGNSPGDATLPARSVSTRKGSRGCADFRMERLKKELDWFVRNRVAQVFVLDSTFNREMKAGQGTPQADQQRSPPISISISRCGASS